MLDPSIPAKHPEEKIKSNVHELILRSKYNPVTFVGALLVREKPIHWHGWQRINILRKTSAHPFTQ